MTFVFPVVAATSSRLLDVTLFDWNSLALIVVTLWWLTSAINLNKLCKQFDMTLSKIAGSLVIGILIIDLLITDINGLATERTSIVMALNIVFALCGFYLVYMLTRIHGLTINKHDPRGLEQFPNFLLFILYPIGIWKFQPGIVRAIKCQDNNGENP